MRAGVRARPAPRAGPHGALAARHLPAVSATCTVAEPPIFRGCTCTCTTLHSHGWCRSSRSSDRPPGSVRAAGPALDARPARQGCGVSRRMLINIEQGTTNPSIGILLKISDALGVGRPARPGGVPRASRAEGDLQLVAAARALAGRGLDGDRYARSAGTFSPRAGHRPGYQLTLIAAEVVEELTTRDARLDFASTRRNLLTRGSTSTRTSAGTSASATSAAVGSGSRSPAPTWSDWPGRDCCGRSSTAAACARTSSATEQFGRGHPSPPSEAGAWRPTRR
jgi:transcriptional regulator with XRE-family HTH domain